MESLCPVAPLIRMFRLFTWSLLHGAFLLLCAGCSVQERTDGAPAQPAAGALAQLEDLLDKAKSREDYERVYLRIAAVCRDQPGNRDSLQLLEKLVERNPVYGPRARALIETLEVVAPLEDVELLETVRRRIGTKRQQAGQAPPEDAGKLAPGEEEALLSRCRVVVERMEREAARPWPDLRFVAQASAVVSQLCEQALLAGRDQDTAQMVAELLERSGRANREARARRDKQILEQLAGHAEHALYRVESDLKLLRGRLRCDCLVGRSQAGGGRVPNQVVQGQLTVKNECGPTPAVGEGPYSKLLRELDETIQYLREEFLGKVSSPESVSEALETLRSLEEQRSQVLAERLGAYRLWAAHRIGLAWERYASDWNWTDEDARMLFKAYSLPQINPALLNPGLLAALDRLLESAVYGELGGTFRAKAGGQLVGEKRVEAATAEMVGLESF